MSKRYPSSSSATPKRATPRRSPSRGRGFYADAADSTADDYRQIANFKATTQLLFMRDGYDPTLRSVIACALENAKESIHFIEDEAERTAMPSDVIELDSLICDRRNRSHTEK